MADAVAPFARPLRFFAREVVEADPRVRVDETERGILFAEVAERADQDDVLEHIREIAGVKSVAIT